VPAVVAAERGELRSSRGLLGPFFVAWLERRKPYLEPGTHADYERHGRLRIVPRLGAIRLTAIDEDTIGEWLDELLDGGSSPKTANNALAVLKSCLKAAVTRGDLLRSPADGVERLPERHREMDYLRLYEIPRYLEACAPAYRPLAEVLLGTGMRISEALALVWADVDLERAVIVIYRSRKARGTGSTKGDRFRRANLSPRHVELLRDLRARRAEHGLPAGASDLVFLGPRGGELTRSDVSRDLHKNALCDAGLRESLRLHDLRHTAAATWLTLGLPLIYVQRQLGHASLQTTERNYGHLEDDYLTNAAARVDAAVWAAAQGAAVATG
jgi:integrase